jgi:hypothetical protein
MSCVDPRRIAGSRGRSSIHLRRTVSSTFRCQLAWPILLGEDDGRQTNLAIRRGRRDGGLTADIVDCIADNDWTGSRILEVPSQILLQQPDLRHLSQRSPGPSDGQEVSGAITVGMSDLTADHGDTSEADGLDFAIHEAEETLRELLTLCEQKVSMTWRPGQDRRLVLRPGASGRWPTQPRGHGEARLI